MRVLLLNSTYEPLSFLTERRALRLMARQKVEIINTWKDKESIIQTVSDMFELPSTLRLKKYVKKTFKKPKFTKYALFNRDNWKCQYCGVQLDFTTITIDHIIPRSQGGKTEWKNCVAACKICNKQKADKSLSECEFILRSRPTVPDTIHFWDKRKSLKWNIDWEIFLGVK